MKEMGEHKQVRKALYRFGQKTAQKELSKLAFLRNMADYNPFCDISSQDVDEAISHMEKIFKQLELQ